MKRGNPTIKNRKNKIKNKTKEWLEQQLWSSKNYKLQRNHYPKTKLSA